MAYTTIDNPELHFQVKTYSGDGSAQSITLDGDENMQPDFIWAKRRNSSAAHELYDSVRGATKYLISNSTAVEDTNTNGISAFNSNGFTLAGNSSINNGTVVAWNWKAGGSASANSDGTESTSVSANTTAGFSIITYAGTTAVDTYGHGLSQAPEMMILKTKEPVDNRKWVVYHKSVGATKHLHLNETASEATDQYHFNNTDPTSSVITLSDEGEVNKAASTYVGYIFHGVKGYSKFGQYIGNGSTDGTFVYLGFRPAMFLIKSKTSNEQWEIMDNKRDDFNIVNQILVPNGTDAETTSNSGNRFFGDFLSNGVKLRATATSANESGTTYIYWAIAESPFVNSKGIPTNAR